MGIPVITAVSIVFYILMALVFLPFARASRTFKRTSSSGGRSSVVPLVVLGFLMLFGIFIGGWVVARLAIYRLTEVLPTVRNLLPTDGAEFLLLGISVGSMVTTLLVVLILVEILSLFFADRDLSENVAAKNALQKAGAILAEQIAEPIAERREGE